jgi:hypothetical protein
LDVITYFVSSLTFNDTSHKIIELVFAPVRQSISTRNCQDYASEEFIDSALFEICWGGSLFIVFVWNMSETRT